MARAQPPRVGEELLAPFRVLAGGEDLATAGAALLERACQALGAVEGVVLLAEDGFVPGPVLGRARPGRAARGPARRPRPGRRRRGLAGRRARRAAAGRRARRHRGLVRDGGRGPGGRACWPCAGPPGGRSPARTWPRWSCWPSGPRWPSTGCASCGCGRASWSRPTPPTPSSCATPTTCAPPSRPSAGGPRSCARPSTRSSSPTRRPCRPWPAPSRPRTPTPAATWPGSPPTGPRPAGPWAATWPPPPAWSTPSCSTTWARSACPTRS